MSPELNKVLIELITGIIYGSVAGMVIGIVICLWCFWDDIKYWRK